MRTPRPQRCRELRQIVATQEAAITPWDARGYTAANVDFHERILHLSGNEFVLAQAPVLRMTAQVFAPVALVEPDSARRAITEHLGIVDAVEAADEAGAERRARAHVEATIHQLQQTRATGVTEE